jgi:hypothetical protein
MIRSASILQLLRDHRLLAFAFALALGLTVFLGVRLAVSTLYWSQHRDAPLAEWMTIGFVANSYDVDRLALAAALGLEPGQRAHLTIAQIADRTGRPLPEVVAILEATIAAERAAERAPAPAP